MKLIFIGIDGGTLDVVNRYKDKLPNFAKLMENGGYGVLESTVPPITCPAWPAMFTGKNPAELGMYYFLDIQGNNRLYNADDWFKHSIFKELNNRGYTTGLLNVPMTYPPPEVRGFVVSGLGTPPGSNKYTYPSDLDMGHHYYITPPAVLTIRGNDILYETRFLNALNMRAKASLKLMENNSCDFMATVFFATDLMQHYMWHHIDEKHQWHKKLDMIDQSICRAYREVDKYIGKVIEKYPDAKILIASDHGFTGFYKMFSVNRWLIENGYMKLNNKKPKPNALLKMRDKVIPLVGPKLARGIAHYMPDIIKSKLTMEGETREENESLRDMIDWDNTVAYSMGISGGIYFTEDRYINEVANKLKDEADGKFRVYKRDDVYKGRYIDKAPGVALVGEKYCPSGKLTDTVITEPFASGMHHMNGMYLTRNMGYNGNEKRKIYDIYSMIAGCFS